MNSIVYAGMDVHKDSFTLSYFDKVKNKTSQAVGFGSEVKILLNF